MLLLFTILELFVYSKAFLIDGASSVMQLTCCLRVLCNINLSVDGSWSEWSAWAACDVTCGTGTSSRLRQCNNPAPVHGGHDCVGQTSEIKLCIDQKCPETCLPGWTQHGQICYHLSTEKENWPGAELSAENILIVKGKFWIGLNDLSLENEWRWVGSGQQATVTFWDPGQPDNDDGNENCVHTDGTSQGKWNDEECSDKFNYYICEKRY
ncbi:TSP2-like protein [Mya arenaria]|uniref:TSP2-like protein n=1 Tax=Mya arenaria TaxID=6604 RepID=A0ABY7FSR3_MYAAR|nr:TSP2-like protein [Mya arenaria]